MRLAIQKIARAAKAFSAGSSACAIRRGRIQFMECACTNLRTHVKPQASLVGRTFRYAGCFDVASGDTQRAEAGCDQGVGISRARSHD